LADDGECGPSCATGVFSGWSFRRRTQSEKQNRHWHDCEVDDETAYGDWDSAEPSEQIAKDGRTYERHCWRGSRQRGQSAVAELHAENKTAQ